MTETLWYYARNDQQFGPVGSSELKHLAQTGGLASDDLVWRDGMPAWVPASSIKGLLPEVQDTIANPDLAGLSGDNDFAPQAGPVLGVGLGAIGVGDGAPIEPPPVNGYRTLVRSLLYIQAGLWTVCILILLVGGGMFLRAVSAAKGDAAQISASAGIFLTLFGAAYVIARAGEKTSLLMLALFKSRGK
jgi:hypothetical protein